MGVHLADPVWFSLICIMLVQLLAKIGNLYSLGGFLDRAQQNTHRSS